MDAGDKIVRMHRLKLGSLLVLVLSLLLFVFLQYTKHAPGLGDANPFGEDPYDAVGSFGVLLAPFAGLLAVVRAFRPYPQESPDPGQLRMLLRSGVVALLAVVVTLAADAVGLGRAVLADGVFPAAAPLAGLLGGMGFLTLLAGWAFLGLQCGAGLPSASRPWVRALVVSMLAIVILAVYPSDWREAGIAGGIFTALLGMALLFLTVWALASAVLPGAGASREDIFDDLAALFRDWRRRLGRLAFPLTWLVKLIALPPVAKLLNWFRPRRHRWHLVLVAAALLGLFLLLPEMLVEGGAPDPGRFLLVVGMYVGIGAAGVLLGYLLLGGYLGIY